LRLAQFISTAGYCSRRQASRLIDDNQVLVNGETAGHLTFVSASDDIVVEGNLLTAPSDSCGLLLLTNDGALTNQLLSPEFKQPKCYQVTVTPSFHNLQQGNSTLTADFITQMNQPITIKGKQTQPCDITLIDDLSFEISLTQGLNRQIRRMCATQGFTVTHLKRVSFAGVLLGDLEEGESRELVDGEVGILTVTKAL